MNDDHYVRLVHLNIGGETVELEMDGDYAPGAYYRGLFHIEGLECEVELVGVRRKVIRPDEPTDPDAHPSPPGDVDFEDEPMDANLIGLVTRGAYCQLLPLCVLHLPGEPNMRKETYLLYITPAGEI